MRDRFLAVAAFSALVAGCVHVDYIPMNPAPHPMTPRSPDEVAVFQTAPPERPYVEVASIETQGSVTSATAMVKLREEAGKHGCDAIIITGSKDATETSGSYSRSGGSVSSTQLHGFRAVCIAYKEGAPPPAVKAATPPAN